MVLFNLNLDDIHPESSAEGTDCGGDRDRGVFGLLREMWKQFPKVRVTLFVTPDWIDRRQPLWGRALRRNVRTWPPGTFRLDRHREWCGWLASLPNTELALHGLHHFAPRGFHSQEFAMLDRAESLRRLRVAEEIFRNAGLRLSRGFRPPGWGVCPGMFEALRDAGFDYVAASGDSTAPVRPGATGSEAGVKGLPLLEPGWHAGLVNLPQNWDCATSTVERGVEIAKAGGLISAKAHIAPAYDGEPIANGLTPAVLKRLLDLLAALEPYDPEFVTLEEVARKFREAAGETPPGR